MNVLDEHNYAKPAPKRKYVIVCDNKAAQQIIKNAYNFFKNERAYLGPPVDITAACLGVSRVAVSKYKNGPVDVKPITRRRPKRSGADVDNNTARSLPSDS